MDRGTRFFWMLVILLLGASSYFGVAAESRRRAVQRSVAALHTGDIVGLSRVIDGDTLLVENERGETAVVRLLGIKAFEATNEKDPSARFGLAAMDELRRALKDEPLRVMVDATPQDKHGRTLAQLYMGDEDVGFSLVSKGLVLVYTVYPFPAMPMYLAEQQAAKAERRGLWGDAESAKRAELLARDWRRQAQ